MTGTRFETYTGRFIDFADPRAEDVSLHDVAHALSLTCRYGGHSGVFYSVAEHALLCAQLVGKQYPELQLAALHHDSHEAYLGDIPTPLKTALGVTVKQMSKQFDACIGQAFGVPYFAFYSGTVKRVDAQALAIEVSRLKRCGVGGDWPWGDDRPEVEVPDYWTPGRPPASVEHDFIRMHHELKAAL